MKNKKLLSSFLIMAFALFIFPTVALMAGDGGYPVSDGMGPTRDMSVTQSAYSGTGLQVTVGQVVYEQGEVFGRADDGGVIRLMDDLTAEDAYKKIDAITSATSVPGTDLSAWADIGSFESFVNYSDDEALSDVWNAAASSEMAQAMAVWLGVSVTDGASLKALLASMASAPANDGTQIYQIKFSDDYKTIFFCDQDGNDIESHPYSFVETNDAVGALAGETAYVFEADDDAGVLTYIAMLEPGFEEGMDETMPVSFHLLYAPTRDTLGSYKPDSVTLDVWMPTMLQMGDEFGTMVKAALLKSLFGIDVPSTDLSAWADIGSFESFVNYADDEALSDVWNAAASSEMAQTMAVWLGVSVTDGASLKALLASMASAPANDGTQIYQIKFSDDYKTISFCDQDGNDIESHPYSFVETNDAVGALAGETAYVFEADDDAGVLTYIAMLEPGFEEGMDETMPVSFHLLYAPTRDTLGSYKPDSVTLDVWMPTMLQMGDEFGTMVKAALLESLFGIDVISFEGGSGTETDPYQIAAPEQLDQVRYHLDKHFKLTADISLEDYGNWEPIGTFRPLSDEPEYEETPDPDVAFTGAFNGDGHTISNLKINQPEGMAVGLFGCAVGAEDNPSSISNLTVANVDVTGYALVGGVIGHNALNFTLKNVDLTGTNTVRGNQMVGGITGGGFGELNGCDATADILVLGDDGNMAGVLGGGLEGCSVTNCTATGTVTATGNNCFGLGGLAGCAYQSPYVENCTASATIAAGENSSMIGGLLGFTGTFDEENPTVISGCIVEADITAPASASRIGGIVGSGFYLEEYKEYFPTPSMYRIVDCETSGSITGGSEALGSIAGYAYHSTVENCRSDMTINGVSDNVPQVGRSDVAVTADNKNLVITADTPEKTVITVPGSITDATLDVAALLGAPAGRMVSATLPALTILANTSISANPVEVSIPAGTVVSAPEGWDGAINMPTVQSKDSVTVTPDSGKRATVNTVIEIGFGDVPLTFDRAVRILIPGQAGKEAGYSRGGVFTKITTSLSEDSHAAGDALAPGGDGWIDAGDDLAIWTKHFTSFVTYTQTKKSSGGGGSSAARSTSGTATITPSVGGTVSLGDEASIIIPANALQGTAKVEVKIQKVSQPPEAPAGFQLAGAVYEFSVGGADSYSFAKSVTIKISFDPDLVSDGATPSPQYYDQAQGKWVEIGGSVSGNLVTASVDHFTQFAVMAAVEQEDEEEAPPPVPAQAFSDVPASFWAFDGITSLAGRGYITGYPDGAFKPNNSITRAEFATVLAKAFGLAPQSGKTFTDTADHWARDYISAVVAGGIASGYDDSAFGPDDPITREQMAVMIGKAAGLSPAAGATSFADSGSISEWAREAVAAVVENGIMTGYQDNTIQPRSDATRAEAVAVVVRALK